jgi:lysophospholipase L1-like esterase
VVTAARGSRALLLLHLGVQAAFGLLLARAYLVRENSLERSGHWLATKTTLERGVMGAFNFMKGGQSVARSRLNLSAWFGYQEVLYKRPLALREAEFEFQLGPKAWLCFVFAKTDSGFAGVRLSLSERFPSQFFTASEAGEFLTRVPLRLPALKPRGWHRALLRFDARGAALLIDGQPAGDFQAPLPTPQLVGFRGGRRVALVQSVVFREHAGDALRPVSDVHESFAATDQLRASAATLLAVLCLNGAAFWWLRRRDPRRAAFATLLANGVGAVLVGLVLAYQAYSASRYPALDRALLASESEWKIASAEEVRALVRRRYAGAPAGRRVLFLGTSQTWGAGAQRKAETFVEVVERRLNESEAPQRFECVNGGISAVDSGYLVDVFDSEWRHLGARAVVIDLGNNDGDAQRLAQNLGRLIALARGASAAPLVVLEPNSAEDPGADIEALRVRHAAMRRVAEASGVPVVDMHAHLAQQEDRGFLWWDSVHLTSFGQRLFAERLLPELQRLLRAPAAD